MQRLCGAVSTFRRRSATCRDPPGTPRVHMRGPTQPSSSNATNDRSSWNRGYQALPTPTNCPGCRSGDGRGIGAPNARRRPRDGQAVRPGGRAACLDVSLRPGRGGGDRTEKEGRDGVTPASADPPGCRDRRRLSGRPGRPGPPRRAGQAADPAGRRPGGPAVRRIYEPKPATTRVSRYAKPQTQ